MIKDRKVLIGKVEYKLREVMRKQRELKHYSKELVDKYNIPMKKIMDILSLKTSLEDESDFILFCFADVVIDYDPEYFYTKEEIKEYSKTKLKEERIKLPITWKLIEISGDQWIGKISIKELMQLRDAQLINYNENAQRTMRHIINGNSEYYRIYLNHKAVNQISESFRSEAYIPNTITLNIPEDSKYYYNGEELVIQELQYFDILDGYHRYIAASNEYNLNPDFDYPMELRVVSFDEKRAQQFIFQEDQKTKMRKIDSDSLNMNSYANKIVAYLNMNSDMAGTISRNGGIINSAYLGMMINVFYFKNLSRKKSQEVWMDYRKEICDKINQLVSEDPGYRKEPWNYQKTMCVIYVFSFNQDGLADKANRLYDELTKHKDNYSYIWSKKTVTGADIRRLGMVYSSLS